MRDTSNLFMAGKYWVGDPCYAVSEDAWLELLEATSYFDDNDGVYYYNGKKSFAANTAYGDGTYADNFGNSYGVDAGLLGIIPLEACDGDSMYGGKVIEFKEDFYASCPKKGLFVFGNLRINTRDEDDDD